MFTYTDLHRVHQQLLVAITDTPGLAQLDGAERMLTLVNDIRDQHGHPPALQHQVVELHELTANWPKPERGYALQCALLALNPSHPTSREAQPIRLDGAP